MNSFAAEISTLSFHFASREDLSKMKREVRCFDWLVIKKLRRWPVQKSPYGTMEQGTWPVLYCALPSPGQGQFVSPAIRSGFECVHR